MLMFDIDITEVGNPMILGCAEEELEEKVNDLIGYVGFHCGYQIPKDDFEELLDRFDINYVLLPKYLKDKIDDEIDIIVEEDW
nr:MAG TPA: hypothetical protein [Bacteriophage sp.]